MKKLLYVILSCLFLVSCKQGECSCEDMIDYTQTYTTDLVGTWLIHTDDLYGSYYFIFDADGTGYYTMKLGSKSETFNWEIKKLSGKYFVHRSNLKSNSYEVKDDYFEVQFINKNIILLSGLNTRSGTYYRQN